METHGIPLKQHLIPYEGGKTELLTLTTSEASAQTIVYIHGYNTFGAWEILFPGYQLFKKGYSIALPSQAGFGQSSGPADFCGPFTIAGIATALSEAISDKGPVVIWGISRGAIVAGLLAAQYPSLCKTLILQSGAYDLETDFTWKDKPVDIKENMIEETGGATTNSLRERSVLYCAEKIAVPTLILHGENDDTISVAQAHGLHERLTKLGKASELVVMKGGMHKISSPELRNTHVLPFIERHTKA